MNKVEIYLAKLNPTKGSEISKIRPVIIFQSPYLKDLPTVIVIPLTTTEIYTHISTKNLSAIKSPLDNILKGGEI